MIKVAWLDGKEHEVVMEFLEPAKYQQAKMEDSPVMVDNEANIVMSEERNPLELAKAHLQMHRYERNWAWLEAHAAEAYSHRGKMICVAGQELFVGDTIPEVLAWAKATHPDDDGVLTRFVPIDKGPRIYAN